MWVMLCVRVSYGRPDGSIALIWLRREDAGPMTTIRASQRVQEAGMAAVCQLSASREQCNARLECAPSVRLLLL